MAQPRLVDVQDVINSHPLSRFQLSVVALCFLVVAIDGFDYRGDPASSPRR